MNKSLLICALVLVVVPGGAASSEEQRKQHDRRHGPPEVALEACANAVQGETCSFIGQRNDTVSGMCRLMQAQELVCYPEGGPPGQTRDNPPE
jgi:hypothetical protein